LHGEAGGLTRHDGNGPHDRPVPRPATRLPARRAQRASLNDLHPRDLARDEAGVLVMHACEHHATPAAQALLWPGVFPAPPCTALQQTGD
jgi:hypothetical protein